MKGRIVRVAGEGDVNLLWRVSFRKHNQSSQEDR